MVKGLFRTEDYVRAVERGCNPGPGAEVSEGNVRVRPARQRTLPVLRFARSGLRALLDGAAGGEFGHLAEG